MEKLGICSLGRYSDLFGNFVNDSCSQSRVEGGLLPAVSYIYHLCEDHLFCVLVFLSCIVTKTLAMNANLQELVRRGS